ncbi:DNA-directed RNA polymerase I subunit RPA1 [Cephus cinctus]|uniref:DNA-directed RNA polymerase subunit n=1 Tax=Cephus cinctus TaxID=211228 RepID=A0AAJ7RBD1_CEPCN|nr:DNA-directed RNA polymerase I subunit RPA1 [Cephus cinctus]XP_015588787.1 DNA-directed RNA polymerase I subunit RPA1 [Cephus cinctus]XP_024937723.1 DNA-directed RNA polymerase I subunit RPA1 [Cephus cinctus]XP_024937724.1 DNA-directed RNA polymerase I subunit RPA1 [Cephus cinctus]XP_024937725.1 DNA-directed RNA polymerase I subunit RPA1 [Cephus cinctus]
MSKQFRPSFQMSVRHLDPKQLMFSIFTVDDIRNLSVTKISTPLSFNVLGHPLRGGLYDPTLGPLDEKSDPCGTCGGNNMKCPGHFGHIDLPMPVVNPLFHKGLYMLIKLSCLSCFTLQVPKHIKLLLSAKLKLLQEGFLGEIDNLEHEVLSVVPSTHELQDGELEYVQQVINAYIQNLYNRERFNLNNSGMALDSFNTKNNNVQWHTLVDKALKQFTAGKICVNCRQPILKITTLKNKIMTIKHANTSMDESDARVTTHKLENVFIMPDQSKEYLRQLWQNEKDTLKVILPCLGTINLEFPTDVFFFEVIPVLPPIVRPVNFLNGQMIEHPQSQVYKAIIQDCLVLRNIIQTIQDGDTNKLPEEGRIVFEQIKGSTAVEKLHNAWQTLQANVDHLMDRELSRTTESANCQGLKQVIEKKEGIIRMHMMGKRVNFAARSVITPDPNLNIDEIGIPEAFALKLTYPVPVTPWNVTELRQMILNGPDVHPGAVMVESEDGFTNRIDGNNTTQKEAIAKRLLTTSGKANKFFQGIKIVHRHLINGDILLLNRQPTLHKPSIMAHKARILKGERTLRLHYANCKAYNADFDGDEMNAHFPQNELARSEGYFIANVSNQYLVPKDGTPLSGLIQDHMISGVHLTKRGQFFTRDDYMQLVYSALSVVQGELVLLPPAIIKPIPLWSGKQIVSTVIINITPRGQARINLSAGAKINAREWQIRKPRRWKCGVEFKDPKTMSEAEVFIRGGELLSGVLDKTHYGATPYGLVHCIFELYGGSCSSKLLSAFGKLFQAFLQIHGFTLGIKDILILPDADKKRKNIINKSRKIGEELQKAVLELPEDTPMEVVTAKMEENYGTNPKFRTQVDRKYKTALDVFTNDINKTCLPSGLLKKFPENNLQLMVQSGAKGSTVNTMQISCLLGQIELEGKRPPLMISGKSLPSFPAFDPTPRSGGFIDGRFMTGIQPQEFFFHCMAGREGLIDTAVKTSRSGYLQRCLIKHLEGLVISYDSTVRDSDGSLIQLSYGEDGLDIPKSRFLRKEQLGFLVDNKDAIIDRDLLQHLKETSDVHKILKLVKKIRKFTKTNNGITKKRRESEFTKFSATDFGINPMRYKKIDENTGRSKAALSIMKRWLKSDPEVKNSFKSQCVQCPDPVTSKYRQDLEYGVLNENIESLISDYMSDNIGKASAVINKKELRDLLCVKVMNTLCPPGEPVGLLAAQSIGEPSTQMTLNTFHFAGRGEMNVTLGIPRLREILMMASKNIKTPSMEIPFKKDLRNVTRQSNKLRQKLTKCVVSNVLRNIKVERKIETCPQRQLTYSLTFEFLPHKSYKGEFCINPKHILEKTEKLFFTVMFREIKKIAKLSGTTMLHFEEDRKRTNEEDSRLDDDDPDDDLSSKPNPRSDLGELHESSDEDEAAEDADATAARTMSRHKENQEYEDPEEEEVEDAANENADESQFVEKTKTTQKEEEEEEEEDKDDEDPMADIKSDQKKRDVINMYPNVTEYDYDNQKHVWCKLTFWLPLKLTRLDLSTVLRNVADKVVLWETPCIRRAFTFQNSNGETILKTDGLNIVEMFKYNKILDLQKLYSNDIYGISQTYGIEAANRVIVKEVKDVFKMYGITVDMRHLLLIADYMTFDGNYQPLSRKGMEDSASPLQQMSFESSLNFLKNATLQGKQDDLVSPSSRLMLGQPCRSGTGACSLLMKMQSDKFATNYMSVGG